MIDTVLHTNHPAMVQAILAPFREFELDLVGQYQLDQLLAAAFNEWKVDTLNIEVRYQATISHELKMIQLSVQILRVGRETKVLSHSVTMR